MKSRKYIFESPFFTHCKKHRCPSCDATLTVQTVKRVVNSKSEEAKNFDFSIGDTFLIGDAEFAYKVFVCPDCAREYSVKEIKKYERSKK